MVQLIQQVLGAWRRAENLAATLESGPERDAAEQAVTRLRDTYHALTSSTPATTEEVQAMMDAIPDGLMPYR